MWKEALLNAIIETNRAQSTADGIVANICASTNQRLWSKYKDTTLVNVNGEEFILNFVDTIFPPIVYADWVIPDQYPTLSLQLWFLPNRAPKNEEEGQLIDTISHLIEQRALYANPSFDNLYILLSFPADFDSVMKGNYELVIALPEDGPPPLPALTKRILPQTNKKD